MSRLQFIGGLKDQWIKEQMLQINSTDFNEYVSKAVAFEAARMESHELTIQSGTSINNALSDLNKISQRKPDQNQSQNRSFNFQFKQPRRDQSQSKTFPRNYQHKSQINLNSLGLENLCLHCASDTMEQSCKKYYTVIFLLSLLCIIFAAQHSTEDHPKLVNLQDDDYKIVTPLNKEQFEAFVEALQGSPWTDYTFNGGKRHALGFTPRLGRDTGKEEDEERFRKSTPYSPRLGKRFSNYYFDPRLGKRDE
ncbi:hypothetical protein FQA39_LY10372 [Lamprigera yunnana]|nr:hypothetical protein FQA39_LY10372 [Lamprigera yunnana]